MNPHQQLLRDLAHVLKRAYQFHFHDFKGPSATPKIELVQALDGLMRRAKNGKYDNEADEHDVAELREICEKDGMSEEMMRIIGLIE